MEKFIETNHCGEGASAQRCFRCRTDDAWRQAIGKGFEVPDDFADHCPFGIIEEDLPDKIREQKIQQPANKRKARSRGLGDTAAKFIHWISFGWIKPCSGCRKRQGFLNRLFPYKQKRKELS